MANKRNRYRVLRAVYGALCGVLFQFAFQLPQTMTLQTVLIFCVMFAYLIPSVITVEYIKSHEINGIKPFMVDEAAFFCPAAFLACIIAELVFSALSASQSETDFSGMGTLIFCLSGVILTAAFWLVYFIVDKAYKKTE
ncbi:MAG: hypothetical protein J6U75_02210 [Clostridia bacterium]|nr:hypothetical protein [Clostridia bacterium]MBP5656932.1 hypothetical protein [Clostridia bacterium]